MCEIKRMRKIKKERGGIGIEKRREEKKKGVRILISPLRAHS